MVESEVFWLPGVSQPRSSPEAGVFFTAGLRPEAVVCLLSTEFRASVPCPEALGEGIEASSPASLGPGLTGPDEENEPGRF